MSKREAMQMIGDLVVAFQSGTATDEHRAVTAICEALTGGEKPTGDDMQEHIDADWSMERYRP